jgi:hypothetical protein
LVDCIDIKVDEEISIRDVSSVESTTEDIVEFEDEQFQESKREYSKSYEDTNTQANSNQQTTSNPPSRITQKNYPASQIIGEKDKGVQTSRRIIKDTEK